MARARAIRARMARKARASRETTPSRKEVTKTVGGQRHVSATVASASVTLHTSGANLEVEHTSRKGGGKDKGVSLVDNTSLASSASSTLSQSVSQAGGAMLGAIYEDSDEYDVS